MKNTDVEIKEKILSEIAKTEKKIIKYEELANPKISSDAVGRVSRMNAINNKTVRSIPLNNAKVKLINLKKVLSKIGTKEFGQCIKCHKPIALGRILIRPESLLCVKCSS